MTTINDSAARTAIARKLRVMIVDDSIVVRGLFTRWIEAEPDFEVVASVRSGREAVDQIESAAPDVVLLDIDMPEMDGLTALPFLLKKKRGIAVIVASTLTRRNAELAMRAMSLGAAECMAKPEATRDPATYQAFKHDLIEKVRVLGQRARKGGYAKPRIRAEARLVHDAPTLVPGDASHDMARIALRPFASVPPRALMIGCSTGGPQALSLLLPRLINTLDHAPILITQHMPATFTTILAEHLQRAAQRPVREARDGEEIKPGFVYLAPGGHHLRVSRQDGVVRALLDNGPPVNFCKPAVDPMFASGAAVWGSALLGVVLTGMGSDGRRGSEAIAAAGGSVMAQDEASSVVWGMPGQTAAAGVCSAVLPLDEMAARIERLFVGVRV